MAEVVQTVHQQVDILCDQRLLLLHAFGRETMGEDAAETSMVSPDGAQDVMPGTLVKERVLGVFPLVFLAMPTYVTPCIWVSEGESVWADSDDIAVSLVECEHNTRKVAREPCEGIGKTGGCPELRTWDDTEGMEEQVVQPLEKGEYYNLKNEGELVVGFRI